MTTQPTLTEVRSWPATVSVQQAARALGCGKSKLYDLIARGEAPVRTLSFDKRVVVITASLVGVLSGDAAPVTSGELLSA
ncbi:DNA-binding protein [Streptomyces sp. NPDC059568]|uniref:DNA-binding protein n=1 Tax=Streptomyces sp. NPDC059568 TaxID=3346868 RepID=UPI0036D0A316